MRVTIRHFTHEDVPSRSALLRDADFQANLTDFAVESEDDALDAWQRRTIDHEQHTKRIYTACRGDGEVIGFLWITSLDWRSQVCELSFALLPRFRRGFGPPAIQAARAHLHDELNMRVVIDQVLEHNTMLNSGREALERMQVRIPYDSYTVGEWRTACYWTQSAAEFRARRADELHRRADRSARIRAALDEGGRS
ncbi:MAG TPA: GNAT family N-acetyltransferase [Streptomyces sp.]